MAYFFSSGPLGNEVVQPFLDYLIRRTFRRKVVTIEYQSALMKQKLDQDVVMFLNLIIQDASEAIKAKVAKRLSRLPAVVQNKAGHRASKMTAPNRIAQQVSPRLIRQLSARMKDNGVTVDIKEIFQDGFYIIFRLRVVHVNSVILANEYTGLAGFVQWFLSGMGHEFKKTIEEQYLPRRILGTLKHELPKLLKKEMKEEKIAVETKINIDPKVQDAYFEAKSKELKAHQDSKNRRLALVRSLRRCGSSSLGTESDSSQKPIPTISKEVVTTGKAQ